MKTCPQCGVLKPLSRFNFRNRTEGVRQTYCNECRHTNYTQNSAKIKAKKKIRNSSVEMKEYISGREAARYERNRVKIIARMSKYTLGRADVDPLFKFKRCLRSTMMSRFKRGGYTKKSKTFCILGCSFEELVKYIEAKFQPGMAWDNHGVGRGKWHLDHVIPLFVAKNEEDVIRLWHHTNLQPLWSVENLKKGKKWEGG